MPTRKRAAKKSVTTKRAAPKPLTRAPVEETAPKGYRALSDPAQLADAPVADPRASDDKGGA